MSYEYFIKALYITDTDSLRDLTRPHLTSPEKAKQQGARETGNQLV